KHIVFFFQAEDGIRDGHVTGVQTCALPICAAEDLLVESPGARLVTHPQHHVIEPERLECHGLNQYRVTAVSSSPPGAGACLGFGPGTLFLYPKRLLRLLTKDERRARRRGLALPVPAALQSA